MISPCHGLTWLRNYIDQCGLAALHNFDRALDRRPEFGWVTDRTLAMHAHTLSQFRIIDGRIDQRRADGCASDSSGMLIRHDLNLHDFLMVGAVIVHDEQYRNP